MEKQYYEVVSMDRTEPVFEGRYGVIYKDETCVDSSYWNGLVFIDSLREVSHWLRPVSGVLLSGDAVDSVVEAIEQCLSRINPKSQDTWDLKAIAVAKRALQIIKL